MLLLAFDTSGKQGSIALAAGEPEDVKILEEVPISGGTFSAQLIPQVAQLLARHGRTRAELTGIAAVSGPGSFTGLRVGLAAVKGLAEVLRIPIATVTVLEVMAREAAGGEGRAAAALDASRNEFYLGEYDFSGSRTTGMLRQALLSREEFIAQARDLPQLAVCESSLAELARSAGLAFTEVAQPRAADVARLGARKLAAGDTRNVETLDADYIRRSDAEIFSAPKLTS